MSRLAKLQRRTLMIFIEEKLEQAVIELFSEEGYKHLTGEHIYKQMVIIFFGGKL